MENFDDDRIIDAKNRVFYSDAFGIGRTNPLSLRTNSNHIYRRTGISQIEDIINCGYVRPKFKVNGGHKKEVFWSLGGDNLFYFDGSPILEVPADKLVDGQIGALFIDDLSAIWIFDNKQNMYINKLEDIKSIYVATHIENEQSKGRSI